MEMEINMELTEDGIMSEIQSDPSMTDLNAHDGNIATLYHASDWNTTESSFLGFEMSLIPEEILERILKFLSPYKDMDTVMLVSKQWNRVMKSVVKHTRRNFHQQLMTCSVNWTQIVQDVAEADPPYTYIRSLSISDRFSHSAAYVDGSMYVFGGCSSTSTTFNDLWRLDLSARQWIRPVAMGSYPSPKACATMVVHQGKLILFGGWSHPIPYPLHQAAHYFSELHQYDPFSNRWSLLLTPVGPEPEPLGGHSASVVADLMVVFGGSSRPGHGSNKVWVYDFVQCMWSTPNIRAGVQPEPRYGQYQCTLDDHHILIMGGCVGHNKVFNDFYLLNMHSTEPWFWTKLDIVHPELAAQQTWCHAACKVNDSIVIVAKSGKPREARNEPAHILKVPNSKKKNVKDGMTTTTITTSSKPVSQFQQQLQQQAHSLHQPQQQQQCPDLSQGSSSFARDETVSMPSQVPVEMERESEAQTSSPPSASSSNLNLLALQQRLHRDCMNLPDRDNHHHNSQATDNDVADGHIERLQNRIQLQGEGGNQQLQPQQQPTPHYHHHHHHQQPHQEYNNQPHAGQLFRPLGGACFAPMPSIRPNATSNRQRQLEALQRQEELLRSKSRALAAARTKDAAKRLLISGLVPVCGSVEEEDVPATVMTKNRMDVHVVDISQALTHLLVEWKPQSHLQPPGAPTETICSSLLEGRGELVLFGGVSREMSSPMLTNVAVNKLYFLHA